MHLRLPLLLPFEWDLFDEAPELAVVKWILDTLPDEEFIRSLNRERGKGRNDYPVEVCWRIHLLVPLLKHPTLQACLAELRRNPTLRRIVGIQHPDQVPKAWVMSRFQNKLGEERHVAAQRLIFQKIVESLLEKVSDFGTHLAGDVTALSARKETGCDPNPPEHLPIANGGRKEYYNEKGEVEKVHEWFGFALHLIIDRIHEVVIDWELTDANTHDATVLPDLLKRTVENLPEDRAKTLAYDKAADSAEIHETCDDVGVRAVIPIRELWKDEKERVLPGHEGENFVYDEEGTIYCYDMSGPEPVRRTMAFVGYEPSRGTLKYRCPAMAEGFTCPYSEHCNQGRSYGRTLRIPHKADPRRFPAIPRHTKTFRRCYKQRTAVERVNSRLKGPMNLRVDRVVGSRRCMSLVLAALLIHVMQALYLAEREEKKEPEKKIGPLGRTRLITFPRPPETDRQVSSG